MRANRMTLVIAGRRAIRLNCIHLFTSPNLQSLLGLMPQANIIITWRERLRHWFDHRAEQFRLRPASLPPEVADPYPDYVTCPHCGEPEVEVWCDEPAARCHNCGRTFDHPVLLDCPEDGSPSTQT